MARGQSSGLAQQIDVRVAAAVIALAIAVFGGIYYALTRPEKEPDIPPSPYETTVTLMNGSLERMVTALSNGGKAPKTMAELPALPDGTTPTTDGWNNEIMMKVNGGGSRFIVEFRSKGEDGTLNSPDDIVVDGTIEKDPNQGIFYVSAQTQRGGTPPPPPESTGAG